MKRMRKKNGGFTLLEVLVALVILAVGLLGLALFQVTAISANKSGNYFAQATFIGQQRLENFRAQDFSTITTSDGINGTTPDTSTFNSLPGTQVDTYQGVTYYSVWYVNDVSSTLKEITLWVYWQDRLGLWHSVSFQMKRAA
ncbi:MAG: type IV pilus modification protein PilV [Deltaproteobacteria bacterium]|nr:MAG: type IV pilus modification protein PilV [Deltaproteobacteria bacterium]